jgi:ribonuclease BN (tRNA processing enzyme)
MKIHFLGTNGWYNTATGETPCVLIDAKEAYVILDAGNAFRKLDQHITRTDKPIYLFLSHFHLDHTYGFHTMPKMKWPQGMTVIGQEGSKKFLNVLINTPWTCPMDKLNTQITIEEVKPGAHKVPVPFECAFLVHADPCLGFRITLEGKVITYLTDTGVCDALVPLAQNADLLITECAWRVQNQYPGWPHLAPEDAAMVAKQADAKQLALMHFDAHGYPAMADRDDAEARAKVIFPKAHAMHDNDTISL